MVIVLICLDNDHMRKYSRVPKSLGKRVKKYRKDRSWSQEDLAEIVGVSSTYVGFIEQGVRVPSVKTMDKIARALGVKISDLLD